MNRTTLNICLALILFLIGCNVAEKALVRGDYDHAFNKSLRKVRKNSKKEKHILILEESFNKSRQAKYDRLKYLSLEGDPDRWEEVFDLYSRMKSQQVAVQALPKLFAEGREIHFKKIDFDKEIIQAKKKAAEYLYVHAKKLLKEKNREKAREAYYEFERISKFYDNYKDTYKLKAEAKELGTNRVLFRMVNDTPIPLPPDFEKELRKISLQELNRQWINYYSTKTKGTYYDYSIIVHLKIITVTPEEVKEEKFTQQKQVKVPGEWNYTLDKNGNVMKDADGNDIKTPKYKTIICTVKEVRQRKHALITGTVDYYNNRTKQLIQEVPVAAETHFENTFATKDGNLKALNDATRKRVTAYMKHRLVEFPHDFHMLTDAGVHLKEKVKNIIWSKKDFLK